jgi:hypothetical protein
MSKGSSQVNGTAALSGLDAALVRLGRARTGRLHWWRGKRRLRTAHAALQASKVQMTSGRAILQKRLDTIAGRLRRKIGWRVASLRVLMFFAGLWAFWRRYWVPLVSFSVLAGLGYLAWTFQAEITQFVTDLLTPASAPAPAPSGTVPLPQPATPVTPAPAGANP